eukprot:2492982-Pyramimonas_sp.AAC.1
MISRFHLSRICGRIRCGGLAGYGRSRRLGYGKLAAAGTRLLDRRWLESRLGSLDLDGALGGLVLG